MRTVSATTLAARRSQRGGDFSLAGPGLSARTIYRIAICLFPDAVAAVRGLGYLGDAGIGPRGLTVLVGSTQGALELTRSGTRPPAIFMRKATGKTTAIWTHTGSPASATARQIADIGSWASPRTITEIEAELMDGRVVLLIYGVRSALHRLVQDMLIAAPMLRLELHDIAPLGAD